MKTGYRIQGRVQDTGYRIQGTGQDTGTGYRVQSTVYRIQCAGYMYCTAYSIHTGYIGKGGVGDVGGGCYLIIFKTKK